MTELQRLVWQTILRYISWYFCIIKLLESHHRLRDVMLHVKLSLMTWYPCSCTTVSSCNKNRKRKQGLVGQCITCCVSFALYVWAVVLLLPGLKNQESIKQTALTPTQEAPDLLRKPRALFRSPSFAGSTRPVSLEGWELVAGMYGVNICKPSGRSRWRGKQICPQWQIFIKTMRG